MTSSILDSELYAVLVNLMYSYANGRMCEGVDEEDLALYLTDALTNDASLREKIPI